MLPRNARGKQPRAPQDLAIYEADRVVGSVRTGTPGKPFVKPVDSTRHMLRSPKAWAVGAESLTSAEALGSQLVILHDRATGDIYSAPIATIRERGFPINRGFGPQIVLVLGEWSRNGQQPEAAAKRQAQAASASDNGQLTLFAFTEPQKVGAY